MKRTLPYVALCFRIRIIVIGTLVLLFALIGSAFAAVGSFVGQVVKGPRVSTTERWVYIQGPHGSVRRVDISAAKVRFNSSIAKKDRSAKPEDALREGAQVRVTASQDGEGEWKATAVEILSSK